MTLLTFNYSAGQPLNTSLLETQKAVSQLTAISQVRNTLETQIISKN